MGHIDLTATAHVFIGRHYASAVCAIVRLSVASQHFIKTTGRSELVFGMEANFLLPHTML